MYAALRCPLRLRWAALGRAGLHKKPPGPMVSVPHTALGTAGESGALCCAECWALGCRRQIQIRPPNQRVDQRERGSAREANARPSTCGPAHAGQHTRASTRGPAMPHGDQREPALSTPSERTTEQVSARGEIRENQHMRPNTRPARAREEQSSPTDSEGSARPRTCWSSGPRPGTWGGSQHTQRMSGSASTSRTDRAETHSYVRLWATLDRLGQYRELGVPNRER